MIAKSEWIYGWMEQMNEWMNRWIECVHFLWMDGWVRWINDSFER